MSPIHFFRPWAGAPRHWSILVALIAISCVAAPLWVSRTAASRSPEKMAAQAPLEQVTIGHKYGELPLSFERNEGQAAAEVKFISRGPDYDLLLTGTGALLNLRKSSSGNSLTPAPAGSP